MTLLLETKLSKLKMIAALVILVPFYLVMLMMIADMTFMGQQSIEMRIFLRVATVFLAFLIISCFARIYKNEITIQIYKEGIFVAAVSEDMIPWSVVSSISRPSHLGRTMHGIKAQDWVRLNLEPNTVLNLRASYKRQKWLNFTVNFDAPHFIISLQAHSRKTIYKAIIEAFEASKASAE